MTQKAGLSCAVPACHARRRVCHGLRYSFSQQREHRLLNGRQSDALPVFVKVVVDSDLRAACLANVIGRVRVSGFVNFFCVVE